MCVLINLYFLRKCCPKRSTTVPSISCNHSLMLFSVSSKQTNRNHKHLRLVDKLQSADKIWSTTIRQPTPLRRPFCMIRSSQQATSWLAVSSQTLSSTNAHSMRPRPSGNRAASQQPKRALNLNSALTTQSASRFENTTLAYACVCGILFNFSD